MDEIRAMADNWIANGKEMGRIKSELDTATWLYALVQQGEPGAEEILTRFMREHPARRLP